jgi:hypothetical protein
VGLELVLPAIVQHGLRPRLKRKIAFNGLAAAAARKPDAFFRRLRAAEQDVSVGRARRRPGRWTRLAPAAWRGTATLGHADLHTAAGTLPRSALSRSALRSGSSTLSTGALLLLSQRLLRHDGGQKQHDGREQKATMSHRHIS